MADGERTAVKAARTGQPVRRYAAFVSYSHTDDEIANWLHRRLETYRIPAALARARSGRRIGKIFRDRVELSAAHDLGVEIHKALEASDALIVLCSPRSAVSRYVEEEIRFFKHLGRGEQIFAAIVDGEPHAAGKPGRDASEECFPRALLYRVGTDGALSTEPEPAEPIAADVRKGKDGRENGAFKLIAGLLDVGLDELVQREKQVEGQRRRRANLIAAGMTVLALTAAAAGGFAWWQQNNAEARRIEADEQRGIAVANGTRATQNEELAKSNEKKANDNFALAEEKRLEAERNADEREMQRLLANQNATRARDTLNRYYATRAWESIAEGQPVVAIRYALGGFHLSPANQTEYESALSRAMYDLESAKTHIAEASSRGTVSTFSPVGYLDDPAMALADRRPMDVLFGTRNFSAREATFSPDGKRIIALDGNSAITWDASNGRLVAYFNGLGEELSRVAYSPDGAHFLTVENSSTKVWDAADGHLVVALVGHGGIIVDAKFSPDGKRIVTASLDGTAEVWNVTEGHVIATLSGHRNAVWTAAFSPDGKKVVTESSDGTAKVWDAIAGRVILTLDGHDGPVMTAGFSPDGGRLITSSTNSAKIWDATDGHLIATLAGHSDAVTTATFSPDGKRVVTASFDGTARVWSASDGRLIVALASGKDVVTTAVFSLDGRRIVTASLDGTAMIWSATEGRLIATLAGHHEGVENARLSPDGTRLITVTRDSTAQVWDVHLLTEAMSKLASEACGQLTFEFAFFSQSELDTDPLLRDEWRSNSDVCKSIRGLDQLSSH